MNEVDFAHIEQALGITVPGTYRRIMVAYPFCDLRPSEAHLPDNAQYVCDLNRQILADNLYPRSWRPCFFAIGTTWGGDAHVIDTSLDDSPVYRIGRDNDTLSTLAPSLNSWVRKLARWYVDFDGIAAASEYQGVTALIRHAGYFATSPEPMDGWHRIVVSSRREGGNSFWVAVIKQQWFVGHWAGMIYRLEDNVLGFCVAWLTELDGITHHDFSFLEQGKYGLTILTQAEFDRVSKAG